MFIDILINYLYNKWVINKLYFNKGMWMLNWVSLKDIENMSYGTNEQYSLHTMQTQGVACSISTNKQIGSKGPFLGFFFWMLNGWTEDEPGFLCEMWNSRQRILVSSDLYFLLMKLTSFWYQQKGTFYLTHYMLKFVAFGLVYKFFDNLLFTSFNFIAIFVWAKITGA